MECMWVGVNTPTHHTYLWPDMKNILRVHKNILVLLLAVGSFYTVYPADNQQLALQQSLKKDTHRCILQKNRKKDEILKIAKKYKKLQVLAQVSLHDVSDYFPSPPAPESHHNAPHASRMFVRITLPEPRQQEPSESFLNTTLALIQKTQEHTVKTAQWALQQLPTQSSVEYLHTRVRALSHNVSPYFTCAKKYFLSLTQQRELAEKTSAHNSVTAHNNGVITTHSDGLLTVGLPVELPQ